LKGNNISQDEINNLNYYQQTEIFNGNPVLLARHFQYRVETFFKTIVVNGPLGEVRYYAIRVEFQVRGSPHIHSLLWVRNAPILCSDNKEEYIAFVDNIIKCELPDEETIVSTYQTHSHSKSCRKYKNKNCRYSFGKFFTDHTIVAEPIPDNMSNEEKERKLKERKTILEKVKSYIDSNLNPRYNNIFRPNEPIYNQPGIIEEMLENLDITKEEKTP